MSIEYIRSYYNVPAQRGMRVVADGKPAEIRGARGQYLRLLLDGDQHLTTWHPTWRIEYQEER